MNLTPKAYKRMVRITQCVNDYYKWETNPNYKKWFITRWPEVNKITQKGGIRFQYTFYYAISQVARGELDGHYAKAFA